MIDAMNLSQILPLFVSFPRHELDILFTRKFYSFTILVDGQRQTWRKETPKWPKIVAQLRPLYTGVTSGQRVIP